MGTRLVRGLDIDTLIKVRKAIEGARPKPPIIFASEPRLAELQSASVFNRQSVERLNQALFEKSSAGRPVNKKPFGLLKLLIERETSLTENYRKLIREGSRMLKGENALEKQQIAEIRNVLSQHQQELPVLEQAVIRHKAILNEWRQKRN